MEKVKKIESIEITKQRLERKIKVAKVLSELTCLIYSIDLGYSEELKGGTIKIYNNGFTINNEPNTIAISELEDIIKLLKLEKIELNNYSSIIWNNRTLEIDKHIFEVKSGKRLA